MGLSRVLLRLQDTTAQTGARAFVLLIGFVALAEQVGLETILGAFAAGALLGLIDRDQTMTHPQFRSKLKAAVGLFIPIFFVSSGLRFDLNALLSSTSTVARVPLFLLALLLVLGVPALIYTRLVARVPERSPPTVTDGRRSQTIPPAGRCPPHQIGRGFRPSAATFAGRIHVARPQACEREDRVAVYRSARSRAGLLVRAAHGPYRRSRRGRDRPKIASVKR